MALSKTIHKDGTATITFVIGPVVYKFTDSEWSKLLASAVVIEEK